MIGGQAGIAGHLKIGNRVQIQGQSGILRNLKDDEKVMGYPALIFFPTTNHMFILKT